MDKPDTDNIGHIRHRTNKTEEAVKNEQSRDFSFVGPVSYVLNVVSVSGLSILDCLFTFVGPVSYATIIVYTPILVV
jgi:hypothetical protein